MSPVVFRRCLPRIVFACEVSEHKGDMFGREEVFEGEVGGFFWLKFGGHVFGSSHVGSHPSRMIESEFVALRSEVVAEVFDGDVQAGFGHAVAKPSSTLAGGDASCFGGNEAESLVVALVHEGEECFYDS